MESRVPVVEHGKVLVVDDDRDMLLLTRMVLEDAFPEVTIRTAWDAADGLQALESEPFDVVLCDYRMPAMDGLRMLYEAARRRPEARRILMTAYSDPEVERQALQDSGVDYFLRKGVSPQALLDTVGLALQPAGEFALLETPPAPL
ncbi:MAG TPA: response regulator [Candidatus Thermoplasmatota archaeon]|nr:response regulator [Candidatus Thermoplasmatota archaeon]